MKKKIALSKNKENKKTKKIISFDPASLEEVVAELGRRLTKVEQLLDTLLKLSNPVSRPKFRSGEWHMRGGNVYQAVAMPGSPNAQEAKAAQERKTSVDTRGDLSPTE